MTYGVSNGQVTEDHVTLKSAVRKYGRLS